MAPPAGPSENAGGGGASAVALGSQSPGNGGSPSVNPTPYGGAFGSYTGRGANAGPHQVALSTAPPEPMQPPKSGALDDFMAQHSGQQQGGQQGPQQQGGEGEAEEGEGEAAGEAAGAGEAGAEAGGAEIAAMFL
jgi:hypothetical protein